MDNILTKGIIYIETYLRSILWISDPLGANGCALMPAACASCTNAGLVVTLRIAESEKREEKEKERKGKNDMISSISFVSSQLLHPLFGLLLNE